MKGIGVIGTGTIGSYHVHRLASKVHGAFVAALFDVDAERAEALAREVGAVAHSRAEDVIDDPTVDAVLVATPAELHAELSLACIAARKPVLCEKPLAPTVDECLEVIEAEVACDARFVQVGFMRRFDWGYRGLKKAIDDGDIGDVLLLHCVHRNAIAPSSFTSEMSLTDSVIHEIDATRWLLGEEIVASSVITVRRSPLVEEQFRDPQLVLLEMASGAVAEVEIFVNCQYGYDVRCEVVGSTGVVSLEAPVAATVTRAGARCQPVPDGWALRFASAYLEEVQAWVDNLHSAKVGGPSAWDGYAATVVARSCVRSLATGTRDNISVADRPHLYS